MASLAGLSVSGAAASCPVWRCIKDAYTDRASAGNGWPTLMNPVLSSKIRENTLHVFGAVNFLSTPLVWALYPETANGTLEEMGYLFMSDSPFVWTEEANFRKMEAEMECNRAEG